MRWTARLGRVGISSQLDVPENPALPKSYRTITAWPRHVSASAAELSQVEESLDDPAFKSQDFENRTVIVLTENASREDREPWRFKLTQHRLLSNRSARGAHIVVDGASHFSFLTNPEHAQVVVTSIVLRVRGKEPSRHPSSPPASVHRHGNGTMTITRVY